jgi:ATP-dependent DNA helicase RecQ
MKQSVDGGVQEVLRRFFGYGEFRPGQRELIDQVLAGGDCLGIMPTGAGKSLCYQVPALARDGLTLVISPLISLMKDQVTALRDAGIEAAYLNSSLTPTQRATVLDNARAGRYRLLYVAPERLETPELASLARHVTIPLVAVDEAHCLSQWGQDFRPSYLRIPAFIDQLEPRPAVGAFTATATALVRDDIVTLLRLRDPLVITTGFDRPNLHLAIARPRDKEAHLVAFLHEHPNETGIVYCATRNAVEEVCATLIDAGFAATRYHAGLSDLERRTNQDDFIYDRAQVMVATNAFGMGIDKSNVRYVVHYNMPKNLEAYYQEAGRSGRDGLPSHCLLLYAPADVQTNRFLITHGQTNTSLDAFTRDALEQKDLELLRHMTFYATTNDCLRAHILDYFGQQGAPFCGNCSNCLTTFEEVDATVEAQKIISCVYRLLARDRRLGRTMVLDILRGSKSQRLLQMGLDTLSTYGIMASVPLNRAHRILDNLVAAGHLCVSDGEYPVLLPGATARDLLHPDARYLIKLPKEKPPREKAAEKAKRGRPAAHPSDDGAAGGAGFDAAIDQTLLGKLKALRSSLAREAEMPAYIVFSDATLRDMAQLLPRTSEEFLEVNGVGTVKLERYGAAFLACIREHSGEG